MDLDNKSDVGMSEYGNYCVHGGRLSLCVSVGLDKEMSLGTDLRVAVWILTIRVMLE